MKKITTIYELFADFRQEQVDEMINSLNDEDKNLLILRYGNDFNNPIKTDITNAQKSKFYNYLIPKMRKIMANIEQEKAILNLNPQKNLTMKEATILSLRFKYSYSIKMIAEFLNIEEKEVKKILIKILESYKEYLNTLINDLSSKNEINLIKR